MVAAIIQARLGSTRLPGKVLKRINGDPLIKIVINRIKKCTRIDKILLATTVNPLDDELVKWCIDNGVDFFRGNETNVLERYYEAGKSIEAEVIVRITADDPFKDPAVIDTLIGMLMTDDLDFVYNNNPTSFPEGLDTEVFKFTAIEQAYNANTTDFEKEHVTQYFYHNPSIFKMKNYAYKEDVSNIRLTIDTKEDFELAKIIYSKLSPNGEMFYLKDILKLLEKEPHLLDLNKNIKRSLMYDK